nr:TrbG/VirB9 family P-type conjugative transfer protein [Thaumasiovibrio subtropicus]
MLSVFSLSVSAIEVPSSRGFDKRVVSTKYNPADVIEIHTKVGKATLIQFEKGEAIIGEATGLGMGDAAAWGFAVRGNSIFLKPVAKNPDTNLIVVTNKGRTYVFDLKTVKRNPHYYIALEYDPVVDPTKGKPRVPCSLHDRNFIYFKQGDLELSPTHVWDDGVFTCMKFQDNLELPLVFQVTNEGIESLVNYHIEEDILIIHTVAPKFHLRLGTQVLGLDSAYTRSRGYNASKTTVNQERVTIHE